MYNIYVTNKSGGNVYVRLQSQKISTSNESFHQELDRLTGHDNTKDSLKTKSSVNSYLVRWGFRNLPEQVTMPFAAEEADGETRLYASLYAHSTLWIMDYEVNSSRYGCVFVNSKGREEQGYHSPRKGYVVTRSKQYTLYLSQANPDTVWIPAKKGDRAWTADIVNAGIDAAEGKLYFGRSSFYGTEPCKVTTKVVDGRTVINSWQTATGKEVTSGELLKDTGYELVRAKIGDSVPPNAVVGGVNDPEGALYLGRVGGNIPCSINTEGGRIKYFYFFSVEKKQVENGEIVVLTK